MSNTSNIEALICFLGSQRGIYIPRDFASVIDPMEWNGIDKRDLDVLKAGPEHDEYWDTWITVLDNAKSKDAGYTLYQDGDLWLIREDLLTNEQYFNLFGEERA